MRSGNGMSKVVIGLIWVLLFTSPSPSVAANYFEGKRVTILVGFSAGGGYDILSRLLAKYLPKYLPGKPNVIVENMPGASSILAANHLYNVVKPDGLTIGNFERGLPIAQLLKSEGIKFDIRKFSWIGSAAVEATVLTLRTELGFKTFDDVLKSKSPIMLGRTGAADNTAQLAFLLKEFAGLNMKLIDYPSSPEIMLAIERKEIDGRGGSYSALKPYIDRGLVKPFLRSRVVEPGIESLPADEDFVTDSKAKAIMAIRSAPEQVGRPYVAPPGTPPEVMKIWREAFYRLTNDPEVKDEAAKLKMRVEHVPADTCLNVMNHIFNQPEDVLKDFSKYVRF